MNFNVSKYLTFRNVAIAYFLLILSYLLLRAFINEFLADETATYWYFIYRGAYWGEKTVWDAANHPLNSFLGHWLYKIFGDVKGWLRISSIFSFVLYAFYGYKICKDFKRKSLQILSFITLISIPYLIEYFAYTRGYGLSMGFFLAGIYYFTKYVKEKKTYDLILIYLFFYLAFISNLTILNSLLLIIIYVSFIQIINFKKINIKNHIINVLLLIVLIFGMIPFIRFAFKLKEYGALYYSSLDGIWDMTGKSLSRYILFTDNDILMYFYLLLFILFLFFLFKPIRSFSFTKWFEEPDTLFNYLFFGNLLAVLFLAYFLKVNYPEDRTGMYFIPLFLWLFFKTFEKIKFSEYLLLFFPITLCSHLSLHSSVFTPDDRLTEALFKKVYDKLDKESTIVVYKTMFANWHYLSSHTVNKTSVPITDFENTKYADIFLTKKSFQTNPKYNEHKNRNLSFYKEIAYDRESDIIAYKRKKRALENLIFDTIISNQTKNGEFINVLEIDSINYKFQTKNLKIAVQGNIKIDGINETDLVLAIFDTANQISRYIPYVFELAYQGQNVNTNFHTNFLLEKLDQNQKLLKLYFWNRKTKTFHHLKHIKVSIFEIK